MAGRRHVDAHHHLWDLSAHYYPWLSDRPNPGIDVKPFARDYGVADYLADAGPARPERSVHVQAGWDPADPVGETRWLSDVAARDGYPHAIVAQVDLARHDAPAVVAAQAAFPLVRGVRQILAWHVDPALRRAPRPHLLDEPAWRRGLAALRDAGLSFDLQILPSQMEAAAAMVRAFPDLRFVLCHLGLPIEPGGEAVWRDGLARLADHPNVAVKLSGFSHFLGSWSRDAVRPYLSAALAAFGADRVIFGSNYPVDRPLVPYARIVGDLEALLDEQGPGVADAVMGGNAIRWYRLGSEEMA